MGGSTFHRSRLEVHAESAKELEERIAELRRRILAHSVPQTMLPELKDLVE